MLVDRFNRNINYLRISVTDRCNLRCIYCTPPTGEKKLSHRKILRYEEILRITRIAVKLGITKLRITGGEPFVRRDIHYLIKMLASIEGLKDLSLTTNGVLLSENLEKLRHWGIKRINVSLDSLDRDKYQKITGLDYLDRVWRGIENARDMGFRPIKLNVVAMKGINDDEFLDFGRLAIEQPFHVRFIEFMPIGSGGNNLKFIPCSEIKKILTDKYGPLLPVRVEKGGGPSRRFRFREGKGEIGFISAISRPFCRQCNRLRITANGKILPCLLSGDELDIKGLLRTGCLDEEITGLLIKAVNQKPEGHTLRPESENRVLRKMCSIGG